ncbi:phosphoenolpyruvate--protein phosphotransferase [Lentisphaerota bacterium ZTH]|nr:phosphoenolpyruvate--protein phosphotransferase [Lentisphaerota bacterium]WET05688.1 phosphoenolpyruvate--protein phosphotransferase [Lentisphaerota bacterium ZTH]
MVGKLLSLLRNISEVIAGVEDTAQVLSRIVKILARSLEVDVCSVYEYDPEKNQLVLAATQGLNKSSVGKITMAPAEGLTGQCFKECRIVNVSDPENQPGYKFFAESGEEKYNSFLAVPLRSGGSCVGVLTLQRTSHEAFPAAVVDTARSLSPQLANLIFSAGILKNLARDGDTEESIDTIQKRSFVIAGSAVNSGVARGKVFRIKPRDLFNEIDHETHDDTDKELKLFEKSLKLARINTLELETRALSMISEADASIFNSHLMFLEDKMVLDAITREIIDERHTLEFSIVMVYRRYAKKFRQLSDPSIRERLIDFKDVMLRLLEAVSFLRAEKNGNRDIEERSGSWVVVARELLPSDLMRLPIDNIAGIVCEKGGATSHVAILAKAFSIPALLGVQGILDQVVDYDDALLDCHAEKIYINPDQEISDKYQHLINLTPQAEVTGPKGPTFTNDGQQIYLRANISLICESSLIENYGAEGIGLYRTEFLFMIRDYVPNEETQYEVFSKIVEAGRQEVTLRLLDAGGDKKINCLNLPAEDNPAMGLRGIRLLLQNKDLLHSHLRAVLRAGIHGKLRILLPMVSNISELKNVIDAINDVRQELDKQKIDYCKNCSVGIMLEVPSAVFGLEKMLKYVDFISLGTNDLMQFSFAMDRGHSENQGVTDCFDPVFLKILYDAGNVVMKTSGKEMTICGEMASNPLAIPLLLGMGIKSFSMPPRKIPQMREIIPKFSLGECRKLVKTAVEMETPDDVMKKVSSFLDRKGLTEVVSQEA